MGHVKVQTAPKCSDTAARILDEAEREREWREHIAPYEAISDAVDAMKLPGWHDFPGVTDTIYEKFGDRIDQLCSGMINLLHEHVGGMKDPDTEDYAPPTHIVMAAIDHAIWLALTDIADDVFGMRLYAYRRPRRKRVN